MSNRRKFTAELKVQAAHRVSDSDRSIAAVARELNLGEQLLGGCVMSVAGLPLSRERSRNR